MSLFGSLMGDLEDDPIFGSHMNSMRQMNSMMNSIFSGDPFGGLFGGGGAFNNMLTAGPQFHHQHHHHHHPQNSLMPSHQNAILPFGFMPPMGRPAGFPGMPNMNMNMMPHSNASFTSTSYVTMSAGPDGRQQIYQASSSTKHGPNGVMETKKTVQDSRTGIKKMAIGHHIGERAHIMEREQNLREGTEEERQDFINLEEEEADEFNREFLSKVNHRNGHSGPSIQCIETGPLRQRELPAIMPAGAPSAQAGASTMRRRNEVVEEEIPSEPIIELPESPSPPPEPVLDDEDEEEEKHNEAEKRPDSKHKDENGSVGSSSKTVRARDNILGVQPRKPIRTNPLATMGRSGSGHSTKSSSGAHPYNAQQSRSKAHRPMKGTGHYHNNNSTYLQNPQYDRDN